MGGSTAGNDEQHEIPREPPAQKETQEHPFRA
jgi:hypothetical protein